ncbi:MAG: glycosyltransferase family 39 protein [Deltaproteobacteria bacterium]|nr:glycosyltransferase family 39 protein [Deltaproteobacteria bacterium]
MMHNSVRQDGPDVYPWGLPVLLAGEARLFSFDLMTFKRINVVFFALVALVTWMLAQQFTTGRGALVATSLIAFNPLLAHYSNHILSELPFAFFSVAALVTAGRALQSRPLRIWPPLLAGGLAAVAFTMRTSGILLLPALMFSQAMASREESRSRRAAALLTPCLAFAVFAVVWEGLFPGGGTAYGRMLSHISVQTIVSNAMTYPIALFDLFTGGRLSGVAAMVLAPLIICGAASCLVRSAHLSCYFLLTLALYIVWPEQGQGYRFMIPLAPLSALFLVLGFQAAAANIAPRFKYASLLKAVPAVMSAVMLASSLFFIVTQKASRDSWHPFDSESTELFRWVRANTPPEAVFSFFKPRAFHFFTRRLCLTSDPDDLRNASYFIYTKESPWNDSQQRLAVYSARAKLTLCFQNRDYRLFRVEH